MTDERLLELLPARALGVLDADDRAYVDAHIDLAPDARDALAAFEEVVGRLGLAASPVEPSPGLRARVLSAASPNVPAPVTAGRGWTWMAAAALLCAIGLVVTRVQLERARRAAAEAGARAETAEAQAREALAELATTRALLAREQAVRSLVGRPEARLVSLGGLPAAPRARARVVFDPSTREAFLLASGLDPAPEGKAYQVWVIGSGPPVPAGVFQADTEGRAVFRLPDVPEVAKVKTFAVTVEPAAGVPAPTGPMVLAGAAS
jgi:anti-sigma-K factor RskA